MKLTTEYTRFQTCTDETIAWLHSVYEKIEAGRPIQPNPFYERNAVLTPEVVKKVIDGIEAIFVSELAKYPLYHRGAQGISATEYLVPPGFDKLTSPEQRAVVQGIDRIFQRYRAVEGEQPSPPPSYYDD